MHKIFFLSILTSYTYAWTLYDDFSLSAGIAYDKFLYYNPNTIQQNYHAYTPRIEAYWLKNITNDIGIAAVIDASYDTGIESQLKINEVDDYKAHSVSGEARLLGVWHVSKEDGIRLALGVGAGSFWLKIIDPQDQMDYIPYGRAYWPLARLYKDYKIHNYSGTLCAEVAHVNTRPYATYTGKSYRLEHTMWLKDSPTLSYGLKSYYYFWNLDIQFLGRVKTMDHHVFGIGLEFNFK